MTSLNYVVIYDLADTRPVVHDPNDWPTPTLTRTYQNGVTRWASRTRCGTRDLEVEQRDADGKTSYYHQPATLIMTRHALAIAHICRSCFPDGVSA